MKSLTFITGGQRSGKSRYGQELALSKSNHPIYLATSRIWDKDFEQRVKRHQHDRGEQWRTIEEEKHIGKLQLNNETVLLDCVTLWLNNFFYDNAYEVDKSLNEALSELETFFSKPCDFIVVSNELGMGVHSETEASRKFADLQGWVNQAIAKQANEAYLMISGIPIKIK